MEHNGEYAPVHFFVFKHAVGIKIRVYMSKNNNFTSFNIKFVVFVLN